MNGSTVIQILTSLRITVVCLLCLIVLVFFGTLYQVDHGIWQSQQVFFYSWFVALKGIPVFPGGKLVLGLLFVNLLAALLFRIHLSWRSLGISLIHVGLLLMLAGGWVTHQFGEDSFLSLAEGEASNVSSSRIHWELSLWTNTHSPLQVVAVDSDSFTAGTTVEFPEVSAEISVQTYHRNCLPLGAPPAAGVEPPLNRSGITGLHPRPLENEPERNVPGAILAVQREDTSAEVLLFGNESGPTQVGTPEDPLFVSLRRKRHVLPVTVALHEFEKAYHPGSAIPAAFSSQIQVDAQGVQRAALIEMNEPFRFNEYTFYQQSFGNDAGAEFSTFAVTRNHGRLIPYVATALTVVGLIVHFLVDLTLRNRAGRKARERAMAV